MPSEPASTWMPRQRWQVFVGILLIVLGLVAISISTAAETVVALVMAVVLMAAGLIQLGLAALSFNWRHGLLHFGAATADMLIGFLLLGNPDDAPFALESLLVLFLAFGGTQRVFGSLWRRPPGWRWLLATGAITLVLAAIVWITLPGLMHGSLWLVAACVALDFTLHGVSWIMISRTAASDSDELPVTVEMPEDRPTEEFKVEDPDRREQRHESPFEEQQRMLDTGMQRLHEREQDEHKRLEKLDRDIQRAKEANKDVLPE